MSEAGGAVDLVGWFAGTDSIIITDNVGEHIAVVNAARIDDVLAHLTRLSSGWESPSEGVPVARVRLNFRIGDRPVGNLGLASTFFTAHVHGGFLVKAAGPDDAVELLDVAGARQVARRLSRRS